ncbi:Putative oxidoreductase YjmC [Bordetella sputigena]|uniref:Ldh family oxidoreductase n=1 Tax=Bordetella sputigena TaxID=1416810 RepID=UPI0039EE48A0
MEFTPVPAESAHRQIVLIARAWGMSEADAGITADVLVDADLKGIDSHGISMLIFYDQIFRAGQMRMDAQPRIVRQTASTALIDGAAAMGHPTARMAMELAIRKCQAADIGAVSVFNSQHFGAAGYYAEMAARQGLIAMVSCSTRLATVVPTRGVEPMLGTNPFAFATPAGRHEPVILDMATSVVASNKVKVYALQGKPLPPGWALAPDGTPLTDSALAYRLLFDKQGGGLAPLGGHGTELGGHKGYGLSLFAQLLGSTLGGGSFSPIRNRDQRPGEPDNIGHFFLVLNPAAFRPLDDYTQDVDAVIDALTQSRPADPALPVLVPGDPERATHAQRARAGIPLPATLMERLREIADSAGAAFVL